MTRMSAYFGGGVISFKRDPDDKMSPTDGVIQPGKEFEFYPSYYERIILTHGRATINGKTMVAGDEIVVPTGKKICILAHEVSCYECYYS